MITVCHTYGSIHSKTKTFCLLRLPPYLLPPLPLTQTCDEYPGQPVLSVCLIYTSAMASNSPVLSDVEHAVEQIKCRRPECSFVAQSRFDNYCCYKCGNNQGHGDWCLQEGSWDQRDPGPSTFQLSRRIHRLQVLSEETVAANATCAANLTEMQNNLHKLKRQLIIGASVLSAVFAVMWFLK